MVFDRWILGRSTGAWPLTLLVLGIVVLVTGFTCVTAASEGPIRIGALFPLSGGSAELGRTGLEGAELAVKEINGRGGVLGRSLELVPRDTKGVVEDALREARRLVLQDGVDFLLGTVNSGAALAVAEFAEQQKVIFMVTVASADNITVENFKPHVFRSGVMNSQQDGAAARFAATLPYKRWAVVAPDYEYGHGGWEIFKNKLKELRPDVEFVSESWPKLYEGDYTAHINSLLITRPEAVYNLLWGGDLVAFVQQGVQFGVFDEIKFLFPTIAELSILRALSDVMPEGLYGAGRYYFNWPDTEDTRRFVNAYLEAYGEYPSPSTAQSYDGVLFLAAAIEKAGTVETEAVRRALEGITTLTSRGEASLRAEDHQLMANFAWGTVKRVPGYDFPVVSDFVAFPGEEVTPTVEEIMERRARAQQ